MTDDGLTATSIDGIPVFWGVGPAPLSAALIFNVGRRDETFIGGGLTHLVEHLVMRGVGRTHIDCNASVDLSRTNFTASGSPADVIEFMAAVCRALGGLPVRHLPTERRVLAREGGQTTHPLEAAAIAARYGAADIGLAAYSEVALHTLDEQDVHDWVRRFFVRDNAALTLTGPPPTQLRLPLAEGTRNARSAPQPRRLQFPAYDECDEGVGLAIETGRGEAVLAGLRIILDRATDLLRHEGGLCYDVDFHSTSLGSDRVHHTFVADPATSDAGETISILWKIFREVSEGGPTEDELLHDREGLRSANEDPRGVEAAAYAAATAALSDGRYRSDDERYAEHAALTAPDVAAALLPGCETALALLPEGVRPPEDGWQPVPMSTGEPLSGASHRRTLRSWAPRGSRLMIADEGISVLLRDGSHLTGRWSDVIGVGLGDDGVHMVQTKEGATLPLRAADWSGGDRVLATLRDRVPRRLYFSEEPVAAQ